MIPVKIGASGTITKSCRKYLSNIPGKHDVKEINKKGRTGIFFSVAQQPHLGPGPPC
jgi:hypothetical protein